MLVGNRRLQRAHNLFLSHSFYPLLFSSGLAVALLAARFYRSLSVTHGHMVWNLFLAWLPYLASLWAAQVHRRYPGRWWLLLPPGALWLVFFPNAPYIVTDLWHLRAMPGVPIWYDIGLLLLFALTGLFLAVFSLRIMQDVVRRYLGGAASWFFVLAVLGLSGLGIYLGRFLRWNSWDLMLHPGQVMGDVVERLIHPLDHFQTFGFTFMFAAVLLVCYLVIASREPA